MARFLNFLTVFGLGVGLASLELTHANLELIQSYSFYSEENCSGQNETVRSSARNLKDPRVSKLGYLGEIKSRCIHSGVWIEVEKGQNETIFSVYDGNSGSICLNSRSASGNYKEIQGIRRAASFDLRVSALSLFTEPYFGGQELYFEGHELRLPFTLLFRSWGSTGGTGWTIYRNPVGDGDSKCLLPNLDPDYVTNFYSVDYEVRVASDLFVGSFYQGCWTRLQPPPQQTQDNLPGLILYDLNNRELYTNGRDLRLPIPIYVTSYTFTGKISQNWTVYETVEERSRFKCLPNVVNASTTREHVLIYERTVIQIMRVEMGCEGDIVNVIGNRHDAKSSSQSLVLLNRLNFLLLLILIQLISVSL